MSSKVEIKDQRVQKIEIPLIVNGQVCHFGKFQHGLLKYLSANPGFNDSSKIAEIVLYDPSRSDRVDKYMQNFQTNFPDLIETQGEGRRKRHAIAEKAVIIDFYNSPQEDAFMENIGKYVIRYPGQELFGVLDLWKATGRRGETAGQYARQIIADVYKESGGVKKYNSIFLTKEGFFEACRRLGPPNVERMQEGVENAKKRYGQIKGLTYKFESYGRKKARKEDVKNWSENYKEKIEKCIDENPTGCFSMHDVYRIRGGLLSAFQLKKVRDIRIGRGETNLRKPMDADTFRAVCLEVGSVNTAQSEAIKAAKRGEKREKTKKTKKAYKKRSISQPKNLNFIRGDKGKALVLYQEPNEKMHPEPFSLSIPYFVPEVSAPIGLFGSDYKVDTFLIPQRLGYGQGYGYQKDIFPEEAEARLFNSEECVHDFASEIDLTLEDLRLESKGADDLLFARECIAFIEHNIEEEVIFSAEQQNVPVEINHELKDFQLESKGAGSEVFTNNDLFCLLVLLRAPINEPVLQRYGISLTNFQRENLNKLNKSLKSNGTVFAPLEEHMQKLITKISRLANDREEDILCAQEGQILLKLVNLRGGDLLEFTSNLYQNYLDAA